MPLYLARGPATFAFLIRARDRNHLNYIIDALFDPGLFQVEVYDGPLCLTLSLPAELDGETDFAELEPDLQVRFNGSLEREEVLALPAVRPLDEFEDEWSHLRRRAFPNLGIMLDGFADETDEGSEASRDEIEAAICRDVIEQGRLAARSQLPDDEEAAQWQVLGMSVPVDSVLSGGATHAEWAASDWDDTCEDPADLAAELLGQVDRAVDRFGEVNVTFTAGDVRWRLGRPVISEGATLTEAIAQARKRARPVEH